MTTPNQVNRQKKIVIFTCPDTKIQPAVSALCSHYGKTANVLVVRRARGEINSKTAFQYYKKQIHELSLNGYTGFVLIGKEEVENLFHETEYLKETFPHLAFDAWRVHSACAKEVSKIS
ncbi:MAG: hypothetical protein NTZ13_00205 [Candidatus Parcubacteria bacterium]|nr:hypothetical protein [Candidatus Parcubacteria bacterium]